MVVAIPERTTDQSTETTPLISPGSSPTINVHDELDDSTRKSLKSPSPPSSSSSSWSGFLPSRIGIYFMLLYFLLAFSEDILVTPLIKLFERSLCISYYSHIHPNIVPLGQEIPERLCKLPEIQAPLATVRGWKSMLDTIPVLVSIPFAKLANRLGIRTVMSMGLIGLILARGTVFLICALPKVLPLRLVYISSSFLLCGGGYPSTVSMMWAMATAIIPGSERTTTFYFIFAAFYLAEFSGSLVSALTTDISPWIPCAACGIAMVIALVQLQFPPHVSHPSYTPIPTEPAPVLDHPLGSDPDPEADLPTIAEQPDHLPNPVSITKMMLIFPACFAGSLRYIVLSVLVQYASNEFGMRISEGAYFYTETAIINFVLFLFIVPNLTIYLRKTFTIPPGRFELFTVQASLSLLAIGSLLIGLSTSLVALWFSVTIFSAGFGSKLFTIALVSAWTADRPQPVVFAVVTIFQTLGHSLGEPALQHLYAATLRPDLGFWWHGLPFWVTSCFYLLSIICTSFVR